jgi:hypothetical protein
MLRITTAPVVLVFNLIASHDEKYFCLRVFSLVENLVSVTFHFSLRLDNCSLHEYKQVSPVNRSEFRLSRVPCGSIPK